MKQAELTATQCEQLDNLHNAIYALVQDFIPNPMNRKKLEWDMEYIGEIADTLTEYIVKEGLGTEMEINPFVEE